MTRRLVALAGLLWLLVAPMIALAQNPNSPNAQTMQGPGPTGDEGYVLDVQPSATSRSFPINGSVTIGSGTVTANQGTPNAGGASSWPMQGASAAGVAPTGNPLVVSGTDAGGLTRVLPLDLATSNTPAATNILSVAERMSDGAPFSPPATLGDTDLGANMPCVDVMVYKPVNGATAYDRLRTPAVFRTAAAVAAGSTALETPGAGLRFRLMRYQVIVTGNAIQAVGGTLTITLLDGALPMGQTHPVFVPAAAFNNSGTIYSSPWVDLGNGILSAAVNNVCNVNLSAALTGGQVQVNACFAEE